MCIRDRSYSYRCCCSREQNPAAGSASDGSGRLLRCGALYPVSYTHLESSGQGPEKVSEEKRLTVYTSHKQEVYAPIIKEFEERTGIWVEVVPGGTTELLERIREEGEKGSCDVMFGGGVESYEV